MHQSSRCAIAAAAAVLLACGSSGGGGLGSPPEACQSACDAGLTCVARACSGPVLEFPYAVTDGGVVYGSPTVRISAPGRKPDRLRLVVAGQDLGSVEPGIYTVTMPGAPGTYTMSLYATYGDFMATTRATVAVDHTSPRLEWTPAPGEASLVGVTELVGRASEPLHPDTSPADVAVYSPADGEPLPAHVVEVDAPAGLVTVRFAEPLDLVNEVAIRSQVPDRSGNREWSREHRISQPPLVVRFEPATGEAPMRTYEVTVSPGRAEEVILSNGDWRWVASRDAPHRFLVDEDAMGLGAGVPLATATRGERTFTSNDVATTPQAPTAAAIVEQAPAPGRSGSVALVQHAVRWPASAAPSRGGAVATTTAAATECAAPRVWAEGGCHLVELQISSPVEGLSTNCGDTYATHEPRQLPIELKVASPVALDEVMLLVNGAPRLVHPSVPATIPCLGSGDFELQLRARVGDGWIESERRQFRVDREPPSATWSPPRGRGLLPSTRSLVATFSEPLDPASLDGIEVYADGFLKVPALLSPDQRQLTLTLPRPLATYGEFRVMLHRNGIGVSDRAGNRAAPSEPVWKQPPVLVALRTPARENELYASGVIPYTAITYGDGVEDVVLELSSVSSKTVLRPVAGPPWRFEVDTSALPDGTYSAKAVARRATLAYASRFDSWWLDLTPPAATCWPSGTWPGTGSALWIRDGITVQFSELITHGSFTPSAVTVESSSGPLPVSVGHGDQQLVGIQRLGVSLATPWPLGETLRITVGGGLADAAGNAVPATICTIAVPEWLPQRAVLTGTVDWLSVEGASLGRIAGDYSVLAAWQRPGDGVPYVSWGASGGFGSLMGYGAERPSFASDPSGVHALAWSEQDAAGTWQVLVAQQRSSGGLESVMTRLGSPLNRDPARHARAPSLTQGACPVPCPIVAWVEGSTESPAALHASTWSGTAWSPLGDDLRAGENAAESPTIAIDSANSPVLIWREGGEVFARRWGGQDLGFLDADGPLNVVGLATGNPALTLDGGGSAVIAWTEIQDGAPRVVVRRWDGASWMLLDDSVSGGGTGATRDPSVVVDSAGTPWVAFVEESAAGERIRVARWDGSSWQPVGLGLVTPTPVQSPRQLALRLDGAGVAWIAWVEGSGAMKLARQNE